MLIQIFGDSIRWGADGAVSRTDFAHGCWALSPAGYIARVALPAPAYLAPLGTVVNCAVPGQSSSACLAGQPSYPTSDGHFPVVNTPVVPPYAQRLDPAADILILAHGILDQVQNSIAGYKANLRIMAAAAIANGARVVFDTPTHWYFTRETQLAFVQAMKDVAAEFGAGVIDSYALTKDLDLSVVAPVDQLHYVQSVYTLMGQNALEQLRILLGDVDIVGTLCAQIDNPWMDAGFAEQGFVANRKTVATPYVANGAKFRLQLPDAGDAALFDQVAEKIVG